MGADLNRRWGGKQWTAENRWEEEERWGDSLLCCVPVDNKCHLVLSTFVSFLVVFFPHILLDLSMRFFPSRKD